MSEGGKQLTYSEIMIQAYAEANGITREEAVHWLKISNLMLPDNKNIFSKIDQPKAQALLDDLRKDPKGVLSWGKDG
jgi:hypothetical protein